MQIKVAQLRYSGLPALIVVGFVALTLIIIATGGVTLDDQLPAGFSFLWRATGWDIGFSLLPYGPNDPYWKAIVVGLLNTILLGTVSLALASVLGVAVGTIRTSGNALAEFIGTIYVELFRNVPLLLQLLLWYKVLTALPSPANAIVFGDMLFLSNRGVYALGLNMSAASVVAAALCIVAGAALTWWALVSSQLRSDSLFRGIGIAVLWAVVVGMVLVLTVLGRDQALPLLDQPYLRGLNFRGGMRISPEFAACVIAISIYGSAYIAEIIRAGFGSVDEGIVEAGKSLGLGRMAILFKITLPLAIRAILPTLTNQYVWLMKATTLGIAVGFPDLFLVISASINQTGQTFELLAIFMLAFLAINYFLGSSLNRVNVRIALKGDAIRTGRSGRRAILLPRSLRQFGEVYFGTLANTIMTCVFVSLAGLLLWQAASWGVFTAVWGTSADACRSSDVGACWSVISARWRLIFFGLYPVDEQWRSGLACVILIAVGVLTCLPSMWNARRIATLWVAGFGVFFCLMRGGVLGLEVVEPQHWGGLSLTLFAFAAVIVLGMPLAVAMALIRRSGSVVASRSIGVVIDCVRSLPLLAVLYSAAVFVPLLLPHWLEGDKIYRVIIAFAFYFACYEAEILRSGFQSLSKGQEEAAQALGLNYRYRTFLVLLPQVFRLALPPTVNQFVATLKETTLLVVVGLFDFMASSSAAYGTAEWSIAYLEVLVFSAAVYFTFIFALSRYGAHLERRGDVGLY